MKKVFIIAFAFLFLSCIAWLLSGLRADSWYPHGPVIDVIHSISDASGAVIVEMRRVNESIGGRGSSWSALNTWAQRSMGRRVARDTEEFTLKSGAVTIVATIYQDRGDVSRVDIRPSALPCPAAENLRAGIVKSFPGMDCRLVSP